MADTGEHYQPLRVLAVDDNAINLSVLTRMLTKKFSHMIDGAPVAVDSGLKALQLLQDHVFDIIFMDIQMPFLSGVDCTERIRMGADGVLPANRSARIVAVTTAIGDEPELLYRRKGFDGLIGKPVAHEALHELLHPLSSAAGLAIREGRSHLPTVEIRGRRVFAPLPPCEISHQHERLFYTHTKRIGPTLYEAPCIAHSSNFEALLKEQTLQSLYRFGPKAMALTQRSPFGVSDRRRLRQYDEGESQQASPSSPPSTSPMGEDEVDEFAAAVSEVSLERSVSFQAKGPEPKSPSSSLLPRRRSQTRTHTHDQEVLTISHSALHAQLQREMEAASVSVSVPRKRTQRPALQRASMPTLPTRHLFFNTAIQRDDEPLSPADEWQMYAHGHGHGHGVQHLPSAGVLSFASVARVGMPPSQPTPSPEDGSDSVGLWSVDSAGFSSHPSDSASADSMSSATTPDSDDGHDEPEAAKVATRSDTVDHAVLPPLAKTPPSWLRHQWAALTTSRPALLRHNATLEVTTKAPSDQVYHVRVA
ncbi:unnamed protein product [Parajaminaea phylloscopi]